MTPDTPIISGQHKTMLFIELTHAVVVVIVVVSATVLAAIFASSTGFDAVGVVYGAAIAYAGGRASASRGAFTRKGDSGSLD